MSQTAKVCPRCQTVNEPDYTFCKQCGVPLDRPLPGVEPTAMDEVPMDQIDAFIGRAPRLRRRLIGMELTGSRLSWNWPVFLTALLGGPLLAPCWFFHRRMNKLAAILVAIGVALTALQLVAVMPVTRATVTLMSDIVEITNEANDPNNPFQIDRESSLNEAYVDYAQRTAGSASLLSLLNMVTLAYAVGLSLAANGLYKKHVVASIRTLPPNAPAGEIAAKGGTRTLWWILLGIARLLLGVAVGLITSLWLIQLLTYMTAQMGG